MKNYEKPTASIITLCSEDVLAVSGGENMLKGASSKGDILRTDFRFSWADDYFKQ